MMTQILVGQGNKLANGFIGTTQQWEDTFGSSYRPGRGNAQRECSICMCSQCVSAGVQQKLNEDGHAFGFEAKPKGEYLSSYYRMAMALQVPKA
ncbi:hypothetical protein DITRI_Ditri03aG0175600 [Diplodiscus trichospermus]